MQKDISQKLSSRISWLALFAACLVVRQHASKPGMNPAFIPFLLFSFEVIAVPFFFFISGFLLGGHVSEREWFRTESRKRIRTLVIPYVLWCLLWLCWLSLESIFGNLLCGRELFDDMALQNWSPLRDFGLHPGYLPALSPLWYIRSLFLMILVSPVVVRIVKARPMAENPIVWGTAYVACAIMGAWISDTFGKGGIIDNCYNYYISAKGLFFFAAGISLRLEKKREPHLGNGTLWFAAGSCVVFTEWTCLRNGWTMTSSVLSWMHVPLFLLCFWKLGPTRPIPKVLSELSFPIYLFHMFPIEFFRRATGFAGAPVRGYWHGLPLAIAALSVSIGACAAIRRLLPRAAHVLFGGR